MTFELRKVQTFPVANAGGISLDEISQAIVRLPNGATFDIGALCYVRRMDQRRGGRQATKVDVASLDIRRLPAVVKFGKLLALLDSEGSIRPDTLRTITRIYFAYMYWCDSNGFETALRNTDVASVAVDAYMRHVAEKFRRREIASRTARDLQSHALSLVRFMNDDEELGLELNEDLIERRPSTPTSPPDDVSYGKVISLSQALFDGLSSVSCGFSEFPFRLQMPKFLAWPEHYIWLFPRKQWINMPYVMVDGRWVPNVNWTCDFSTGKINQAHDDGNKYWREQLLSIQAARETLLSANEQARHISRLRFATTAHNAFFQLFLANTGMNEAGARELSWSDAYEVGAERQRFRTVKWRAGAKVCTFEIGVKFLPKFKQFLELRAYMLNGEKFPNLFLSFGREEFGEPKPVRAGIQDSLFKTLKKIDPDIEVLKSRKLRSGKSDFVIRKTDLVTGAAVMQNSESTFLKHYTAGSEATHFEEMSSYLGALAKEAHLLKAGEQVSTQLTTGGCANVGKPMALLNSSPVAVDCQRGEGCLFCSSYRIHADVTDAIKLLSCRFYAEQLQSLCLTQEEHERSFAPLFARIDELLGLIEARSIGTVARAKEHVEAGEFPKYWEAKVEMLIDCGVM